MARRPRIWTGRADEYVSVIGVALVTPIIHLLEDLHELQSGPPNEVQASNPENGLAVGVVALAATIMESALNRTRFVRKDGPRGMPSAGYFAVSWRQRRNAPELQAAIRARTHERLPNMIMDNRISHRDYLFKIGRQVLVSDDAGRDVWESVPGLNEKYTRLRHSIWAWLGVKGRSDCEPEEGSLTKRGFLSERSESPT